MGRGREPLPHPALPEGPPPRAGEVFASGARRLAGVMGAVFGWSPDAFWRATPDEVVAVIEAVRGDGAGAAVDRDTLARLMKEHPDG